MVQHRRSVGVLRSSFEYRQMNLTTGIIVSILLGFFLPCRGEVSVYFEWLTQTAIVLLFFMYGVKLSRKSVTDGIMHWRLQCTVLFSTFVLFPVMVWLGRGALEPLVGASLYAGFLYIACLPSTVQSSIAFTSVAGGNVPAAVCAASVSSLFGVLLTPLLVGVLFSLDDARGTSVGLNAVLTITYQILLPFAVGQLMHSRLKPWVARRHAWISANDRFTIWLVVYTSFSSATVQGYWQQLSMRRLMGLILASLLLLLIIQCIIWIICKLMHFNWADRVTILFCGSKKSLAVGAPMMLALFGGLDNNLLLPLMVFHQVQLMVCSYLATHRLHRTKS